MKFIVAVLAALMLVACGQREVVSTDTAQSSTVVTNTETSTTVTPSQPVNVSTAPGQPSATKKTKH
jgi:uncharacterized protein YcfL